MGSVKVEDQEPTMNYAERVAYELFSKLHDCPPQLIKYYALVCLIKGENTSLEDVHDAWSVWKNDIDPGHKSLIPFDQLASEVQDLDDKYAEVIREVAKELSSDVTHG